MALIPSVKVTNGLTLQRSYFTSELFVRAAREDIEKLLSNFDHVVEDELEPFKIFKQVWVKEGWNYAHLYIWEITAREEYLRTMFRLFIEHMNEEEDEVLQIGAVFGLYTLYELQIKSAGLHRVIHIPICIDALEHLSSLAQTCEEAFRPHFLYILRHFISKDIFHILPPSNLKPYNPTVLPHSFIIRKDDESLKDKGTGKTRAEREIAGRAKWHLLHTWVDERADAAVTSSLPRTEEYDKAKAEALEDVPSDIERTAERNALARLKTLEMSAETGTSTEGIERFEKMLDKGAGILRNQWSQTGSDPSRQK